VSISIDAVSGVSGFINPGDRVDVFMIRGSGAELSSNLILENIQIIAVDQQTNTERNAPVAGRTVTVEVTPTEAQKLALAQQVGRLSLTLRGFGEQEIVGGTPDQRSIGMQDLLGVERRERTGTSVTVRKGGAVTDSVTFE
jgi:pilus assembly protein CpaB